MIEQVKKEPITKLSSLRVGQMITQDYGKPTQRALTVIDRGDHLQTPIVWLESRAGNELELTQADLDIRKYDLQTVPKRQSL